MANDSKTTILDEALLAVLKEKLPQMQVDFVTEALQSIPKLEEQLLFVKRELTNEKENSTRYWKEREDLKNEVEAFKKREENLLAREKAVEVKEIAQAKRELNWDNEILKKDVECQLAITANLFNITSQVFNSPVFTQTVVGSMSVKNNYGSYDSVPYNQLQTFEQVKNATHRHNVIPGVNETESPK